MRFQTPLVPGRLIRRYKRFFADVMLEDGTQVTAHCPKTGPMTGLVDEGQRVWLEPNDDPKKKLKYGWRLVDHENGHFTGVDTGVPNRVVREGLQAKAIAELAAYDTLRAEVKYGTGSRIDFLLTQPDLPDAYVEIKSVTLRRDADWAEFPDTVTTRGAKHLDELSLMAAEGHRAVMLYLVQRTDCAKMRVAGDIDPAYGAGLARAMDAGVEVICYATTLSPEGVTLAQSLPVGETIT